MKWLIGAAVALWATLTMYALWDLKKLKEQVGNPKVIVIDMKKVVSDAVVSVSKTARSEKDQKAVADQIKLTIQNHIKDLSKEEGQLVLAKQCVLSDAEDRTSEISSEISKIIEGKTK